jgi:hypothetical protein
MPHTNEAATALHDMAAAIDRCRFQLSALPRRGEIPSTTESIHRYEPW